MQGETYEEFVEKFKPKKTTDDCYTPTLIYEAVADWVAEKYQLDKKDFVRPFFPGGDYENYKYPDEAVVVDNPPFSIIAKIAEFYAWKKIPYFLFAPSLTCISPSSVVRTACAIPCGVAITYANGASVSTGFITNLETEYVIKSEPELYKRVSEAEAENRKEMTRSVPKYAYPNYIVTAAMVQKYSKYGVNYSVKKESAIQIRDLDAQLSKGKTIFGGGLLLSEKAAAEKAAAEKAAAEKAAAEKAAAEKAAAEKANAIIWELSDREKMLVEMLNQREAKHDRKTVD